LEFAIERSKFMVQPGSNELTTQMIPEKS